MLPWKFLSFRHGFYTPFFYGFSHRKLTLVYFLLLDVGELGFMGLSLNNVTRTTGNEFERVAKFRREREEEDRKEGFTRG